MSIDVDDTLENAEGEVIAWSGELYDYQCRDCQEKYMEIVKFGDIGALTMQGPYTGSSTTGLKCIQPDCQEEYLLDEPIDDVEFIDIMDRKKQTQVLQQRSQLYATANRAKNIRDNYVPVKYNDLPEEPELFLKHWKATPEQLLKVGGLGFAGSGVLFSIIWIVILGLAFVLNRLAPDWAFPSSILSSAGGGFRIILIIAVLFGIIAIIFTARNDQHNGIMVHPARVRFLSNQYDPTNASRPYLVVDFEGKIITMFNVVGVEVATYGLEELTVTEEEFQELVTALNNQELLYVPHEEVEAIEEDEDLGFEILEPELDDQEFFYEFYTEKLKVALYNQMSLSDRLAKKSEQMQKQQQKMAAAAPGQSTPMTASPSGEALDVAVDSPDELTEDVTIDFGDDRSSGTLSVTTASGVLGSEDYSIDQDLENFVLTLNKAADADTVHLSIGQDRENLETYLFSIPDNVDLGRKIRIRISFDEYLIDTITFNGRKLEKIAE